MLLDYKNCLVCGTPFSSIASLLEHEEKCIPKMNLKCKFCWDLFSTPQEVRAHHKTHNRRTPYLCLNCMEQFTRGSAHRRHMEVCCESPTDEEILPEIPLEFQTDEPKKSHIVRPKPKNFKCQYCLVSFKSAKNLRIHLMVHPSEKPYICLKCEKQFIDNTDFKQHIRAHGIKEFEEPEEVSTIYDITQETYGKPSCKLKIREKGINISNPSKTFCKACSVSFPSVVALEQHLQMDQLKDFKCTFCGKLFAFQKSLIEHTRIHQSQDYMCCEICHCNFTDNGALITHLKTHENASDCWACDKTFFIKDDLFLHLSCHEEGQFECVYCRASIEDSHEMDIHLARHHEAEKCVVCDRKFNRTRDLEAHYHQVHMTEMPFSCFKCAERFTNLEKLSAHAKTHRSVFIKSNFPCRPEIDEVAEILVNY